MADDMSPTHPRAVKDTGADWLTPAVVYSGAVLLGAAMLQRSRSRRAEAEHPPMGRFLAAGGLNHHYVDVGSGPAIVFIHGIGATLEDWFISGVLDPLLPHHRIIAVDRPGYGYTARPSGTAWTPERQAFAIAALLHRLGAEDAVIVGHSYGVLPALALALQHDGFARALVLVAGVYYPGTTLSEFGEMLPSVPLLGPLARATLSPALARSALPTLERAMFEPQPVTRAFRERFSPGMATRPSQLKAIGEDNADLGAATLRFGQQYRRIPCPVTVVTGSGDAIVNPDAQSRRFASEVIQSRLMVVPAAGHMVHHSAPSRVAAAIMDTVIGIPADPETDMPDVPASPQPQQSDEPANDDRTAKRSRARAEPASAATSGNTSGKLGPKSRKTKS